MNVRSSVPARRKSAPPQTNGMIPPPSSRATAAQRDDGSVGSGRPYASLRRIQLQSESFRIPTNEEVREEVHEEHGHGSWNARVLHVLHSRRVEYSLMALLLLDVLVLFIELFVSAAVPSCHYVVRDAISCCPAPGGDGGSFDGHLRFLAEAEASSHGGGFLDAVCEANGGGGGGGGGGGDHLRHLASGSGSYHAVCEAGYDATNCPAGCDVHKHDAIHSLHNVLFSITIVILGTFMVELLVLIAALGPRSFFSNLFYCIDFVVVLVSLILESFFFHHGAEALQALVGLVVFARCWRFVRIGHGLMEVTHQHAALRHEGMIKYKVQLVALLEEHGIPIPPTEENEPGNGNANGNEHGNGNGTTKGLHPLIEEEEEGSSA